LENERKQKKKRSVEREESQEGEDNPKSMLDLKRELKNIYDGKGKKKVQLDDKVKDFL